MRTFQQTISARAGEGYCIHVEFADGTSGIFDFSPYLKYPCYEPLRERGGKGLYKMLQYMIDCDPREVAVSWRALKQARQMTRGKENGKA